ncbi:MAG: type II toxin-antitoxin system RelE/ParE family toxin [Promethearchaeota archaeon]
MCALEDIESISSYISRYYPEKANELIKGIINKIEQLKQFPKLGRKFPERDDDNIREIIYKKYRIIYEIKENIIEILVIAHTSRLLKL